MGDMTPESALAFLAKPFTRDELLTIVAKTLAESSRPSRSGAAHIRRPAHRPGVPHT
jgi:DNA-binding NtrC family response regulator